MHFLLTNDDGIRAPGLWAAARVLSELGSVLVVAPSQNYSGYGAALPPARELVYHSYSESDLSLPRGVTAFAVSGTPATCVQVGLSGALSKRPIDFVVSGINDCRNAGRDIFYSGTVGAAMTAHLLGRPAAAVSLDGGRSGVLHWESGAWAIGELVRTTLAEGASQPMLFNVNVPNLPLADLRGVQMTSLSRAICLDQYRIAVESDHFLCVSPRDGLPDEHLEPGTDTWAMARGYVSITPLRLFPDLVYLSPWSGAPNAVLLDLPEEMDVA